MGGAGLVLGVVCWPVVHERVGLVVPDLGSDGVNVRLRRQVGHQLWEGGQKLGRI